MALFNRSFAARSPIPRPDTPEPLARPRPVSARPREPPPSVSSTVNHYLVKPFERRWRDAEDVLAGLFRTAAEPADAAMEAKRYPNSSPPVSMFEKAANVDEFNVIHAAERMARTGSTVRVLVVLADGMTRGSVEALPPLRPTASSTVGPPSSASGSATPPSKPPTVAARWSASRRRSPGPSWTAPGRHCAAALAMWGMEAWWQRASRTPERGAPEDRSHERNR